MLLQLHDHALPAGRFEWLRRKVYAVGRERLRSTYQTTFWFDLGEPTCAVEVAIHQLRHFVPGSPRGVEWWLSRMYPTDVQVDFHQDRDEKLALRGGPEVHPAWSSVLFLNRVRGGALAVTREPPCEDNPARAPKKLALDLAAPRPNRLVWFRGDLTHGVLDANNQIPEHRLPGDSRLRVAVILNWWRTRPTGVPTYLESRVYPALRLR